MIRKLFPVPQHSTFGDVSLLLLRLVAGLAFILHGWPKIQNAFSWMPPDSPVPGFFQMLAAVAEFGGGLAWVLGLLTPLAAFGLVCTMAVAASFHAFINGDPFVSQGGASWELAAVYLCVALVLMALGPGRLSLDRMVFGERPG